MCFQCTSSLWLTDRTNSRRGAFSRTPPSNVCPTLRARRATSLKFAYLCNDVEPSACELKNIYTPPRVCAGCFAWNVHLSFFLAESVQIAVEFSPKNHLLTAGNLVSVCSSPRGWEVNSSLRLCKNICGNLF